MFSAFYRFWKTVKKRPREGTPCGVNMNISQKDEHGTAARAKDEKYW